MTTDTDPYEAQFLALCRDHEGLRRECPNCIDIFQCANCQARGWLPLPEAKRLGALVRVAIERLWCWELEPGRVALYPMSVSKPRAYLVVRYGDDLQDLMVKALTAALTAAQEVKP